MESWTFGKRPELLGYGLQPPYGDDTVVECPSLASSDTEVGVAKPVEVVASPEDLSADDERAAWILAELKKSGRIRKQQIVERTGCGDSTARRTLTKLREQGEIVFEGSARSGYWRLAREEDMAQRTCCYHRAKKS